MVRRLPLLGLFVAALVLLLDQLSKQWILWVFSVSGQFIEITEFFNLALVWNTGISFGLLAEHRQPYLLVTAALVIVGILLGWLHKNTCRLTGWGLGLVIGGASGNIIDRVRFGAVVDFLDFHIGPYHWPAFNIADSAIFIGVVLLCAGSMVGGVEKPKETEYE